MIGGYEWMPTVLSWEHVRERNSTRHDARVNPQNGRNKATLKTARMECDLLDLLKAGPMSVREIAAELGKTKTTIESAIKRLMDTDVECVKPVYDPNDARRVRYALT